MSLRPVRILVAAAVVLAHVQGQWQLDAVLSGANEVPPVPTAATGFGTFTLNRPANTITYLVSVSGVSGTAAHLHMAPAGSSNPAIFLPLTGGPAVWQGTTAALTGSQVVTLLTDGLYVNVHSAAFPGGEIRGQLVPVRRTWFTASIDESQETPPSGSLATGSGRVRLNEPEGRLIYDLKTSGVAATVAHVHVGAPGVAGPPLFTLAGSSGHWCGISPVLSSSDIATLKAGGMYFNVHSMAFPLGEIRGQIVQSNSVFSVALDGSQVVPPNGSPATGCGRLELDPATNTLSYDVTCSTLPSGLISANLHTGVIGQSGSSFHALAGGPTSFVGSVGLTSGQLTNLLEGGVYIDIHSNAFPGGEIRGQVRPDPYLFGFGGTGTNGPTRIDAAGYDGAASTTVTVSLTNALPGSGILLFISGSSAFWTMGGVPLPVLVAPHGHVWIDLSPSFALPMTADATGCAEITANVPTDPAFECFRVYGQCASVDPIAGATPLIVSDAFELTIL